MKNKLNYPTNHLTMQDVLNTYEERLAKEEVVIKLHDAYIKMWFDSEFNKYQVLVDHFDIEVDNTSQNFLSETVSQGEDTRR